MSGSPTRKLESGENSRDLGTDRIEYSGDVTVVKVYFPDHGQIQVHQSRVAPCPEGFPAGYYWYGPKRHSPGRPPKWVQSLLSSANQLETQPPVAKEQDNSDSEDPESEGDHDPEESGEGDNEHESSSDTDSDPPLPNDESPLRTADLPSSKYGLRSRVTRPQRYM